MTRFLATALQFLHCRWCSSCCSIGGRLIAPGPTAMTASSASRARCRCRRPSAASRPISPRKGIKFFSEIDQSKLAADAGIKLRPSTLLVFGNPPLGTQFITRIRMPGWTGRCGCC